MSLPGATEIRQNLASLAWKKFARLGFFCLALSMVCTSASAATTFTLAECGIYFGTGDCELTTATPGKNPSWDVLSLSGTVASGIEVFFSGDEFLLVSAAEIYGQAFVKGTASEDVLPIHADFTALNRTAGAFEWLLTVQFGNSTVYSHSDFGFFNQQVTFDAITGPISGSDNLLRVTLHTNAIDTDLSPYTLVVPGGASVDINAGGVPEPASILTALGGLAGFVMFRRRR